MEDMALPLPAHVLKCVELLRDAPFLFPFVERVRFFNALIVDDREKVQGQFQAFLQGRSINLTVRREHVYEDAFDKLTDTSTVGYFNLPQPSVGVVQWVCPHRAIFNLLQPSVVLVQCVSP